MADETRLQVNGLIKNPRVSAAPAEVPMSSGRLRFLPAGWPGQLIDLHGRRKDFRGDPSDQKTHLYVIRCTLQRPGFAPLPDRQINLDGVAGNSHLRIKPATSTWQAEASGKIRISVNTARVQLVGSANKDGFLHLIESLPTRYKNMDEAEFVLTREVLKALSLLSLRKDVPLTIYQVRVECVTDGSTRLISTIPFWQQEISTPIKMMAPNELLFCAALYREASESHSVMYSFLCMYKIIGSIRAYRTSEAKSGRLTPEQRELISRKERLPSSPDAIKEWIASIFDVGDAKLNDFFGTKLLPPGVEWGMKFTVAIDKYYRPKRNEIAHAFDEADLNALDPDDISAMLGIRLSLPLLKIIIRMMVANTFTSFLAPPGVPLKWQ